MRTITKTQLRILLTLCVASLVASAIAGAVTDSWLLPQSLLDYRHSLRGVPPTTGELIIDFLGFPGIAGGFVALVGLYRFSPFARWLGVATWIYILVWMAFSREPVITSPLDGALSQCSTLLAGMVLAIVYFSPAANWFRRTETENENRPA